MSDVLLGIGAALLIGNAIENYVLIGQNQWLKNHAEADRDDRAQMLDAFRRLLMETPTPDEVEPVEDVEPAPRYPRLRAAAEAVNARMQPTFLEPEPPITQPHRVVRPSPVPREVEPMPVTEPMEIADEMAADAHAYVAREAVLSDEEWQAKQEADHLAWLARMDEMTMGTEA